MTLGTRLFTWLNGVQVGVDAAGNRYFRTKDARRKGRPERRWVMYNGLAEATKVPPEWHGWLHRTVDEIPDPGASVVRSWQKPHLPNLTGTSLAYRPPGSTLKHGVRARGTGDYEPWRP